MSASNGPILISDPLPPATEEILRNAGLEVIVGADKVEESLPSISGWILRSGTQITSELLDQAPNLKCICRAGAGVDNIDCDAAAEKAGLVSRASNPITTDFELKCCATARPMRYATPSSIFTPISPRMS